MSAPEHALSSTASLARELVRRPSITPDDAGCQELIAERLAGAGFRCETISRGGVTNSWIRRGDARPLFVLAGHTDVVPTGPESQWRYPPFDGVIAGDMLHGRGAADMKGSVAAFVCACEEFVAAHSGHKGSIALLITSDEEGVARDGTLAVLDVLSGRGESIDLCIVGEPSSTRDLGDVIKVGRRGSLGATVKIREYRGISPIRNSRETRSTRRCPHSVSWWISSGTRATRISSPPAYRFPTSTPEPVHTT